MIVIVVIILIVENNNNVRLFIIANTHTQPHLPCDFRLNEKPSLPKKPLHGEPLHADGSLRRMAKSR